jgi:2-C-methyl-D-erythritol 4-phosphate cytidylyltransferase
MATFSVVLVTAAPAGQAAEAGGAFVKVDGRETLLRSVELFLNRDPIKQIRVVFMPDFLEDAKRKFGNHLGLTGVKVAAGGPRWIDQLAAAAEKLADDTTHVIVHDAARPAVAYSDIDELLSTAEKHAAISLATALRAPLVEVDEGNNPVAFHEPGRFMHLVTPQVYARERFLEMCRKKADVHASELMLIKGSPLNVRVGGAGDAGFVKTMINMLPKPKIKAPLSPFEEAQWERSRRCATSPAAGLPGPAWAHEARPTSRIRRRPAVPGLACRTTARCCDDSSGCSRREESCRPYAVEASAEAARQSVGASPDPGGCPARGVSSGGLRMLHAGSSNKRARQVMYRR